MLLTLLSLIILLSLFQARLKLKGFHDDYLVKDKTDSVKGIFILLIVLTHSMGYMHGYAYDQAGDACFKWLLACLSQLVVVMFLFYSGYGISESFKKKGMDYVKKMPVHRILTTLLNFDIAVVAFIILCLIFKVPITVEQSLLSLVAWESVGNSNWYIFVILACYVLTYLVLMLRIRSQALTIVVMLGLSLLLMFILAPLKPSYWYDTFLCFLAGYVFSIYRESIEAFLKKYYWLLTFLLLILFGVLFYATDGRNRMLFNLTGIVFAMLMILLTMKLGIKNPILRWFGKNLFPVYIYMRVPMLIIEHTCPEMIAAQPAVFILISLAITVFIAHLYRYWQVRL